MLTSKILLIRHANPSFMLATKKGTCSFLRQFHTQMFANLAISVSTYHEIADDTLEYLFDDLEVLEEQEQLILSHGDLEEETDVDLTLSQVLFVCMCYSSSLFFGKVMITFLISCIIIIVFFC